MINILFFDDQPYASENRLFRMVLRDKLKELCTLSLKDEKSVSKLEEILRNEDKTFHVIILDIMASPAAPLYWIGTNPKEKVPDSLIGVELLRRCRSGIYHPIYKSRENKKDEIPIYMRTARGEPRIKRICIKEGATNYYSAGSDDEKLISEIKNYLAAQIE